MKRLISIVFFFASMRAVMGLSVVELKEGASVTGDILGERSDKVVIDLGFTVLSIPRESIASIVGFNDDFLPEVESTDIFQTSGKSKIRPLKDWVAKRGEGVVLIQTRTGLGSGFVINEAGYIVTNDHVIAGEHEVTVTVFEQENDNLRRSIFENVKIIASNPELDLALLKIETEEDKAFISVPLGDSDELKQGQTVFAVGSPLGLERSVSQGIVSIRNRLIGGHIYIQTTTEINPGNSGGPLFNLKGEVIGVNNMKIVTMGAEGLGFAIPANVLKMFLRNRDAFSFDPRNPNTGFRYNSPPQVHVKTPVVE